MRTFLFTFEALLVWKPPWKHWIKICSGKTFKIRRLSEIIYFHWRVAENPIFCWERGEEKKKKSQLFWILGQLFSSPSGTAQSNLNGYLRNEVRIAPEAGGPLAMKTRAGGKAGVGGCWFLAGKVISQSVFVACCYALCGKTPLLMNCNLNMPPVDD